MESFLSVGVVLGAGLIATLTDLRQFRISNAITLPLLASGLLYHGVWGPEGALIRSVTAALLGFSFLFLFYLMGGIGGGDVKLMAAVGAWLGFPLILYVLTGTAFAAGLYALVLIVRYRRYRETWLGLQVIWLRLAAIGRHLGAEDQVETEVQRPDARQRLIPFAAMITLGVIGGLLWFWFQGQPW